MKILQIALLILLFKPITSLHATDSFINTEDHPDGVCTMSAYIADRPVTTKELRKLRQEEKHYVQLESKLKKLYNSSSSRHHGINNIHDPVDKWFWIWVIGWGLGILITIISGATIASGFLGILWFSFFIIGSIAMIIWLIKKFGANKA